MRAAAGRCLRYAICQLATAAFIYATAQARALMPTPQRYATSLLLRLMLMRRAVTLVTLRELLFSLMLLSAVATATLYADIADADAAAIAVTPALPRC